MAQIDYPTEVRALMSALKSLPGIGPRSAERLALWLLVQGQREATQLGKSLELALENVADCPVCGFFSSANTCLLCDGGRDHAILCVVERATDILPLERTGVFSGAYHVLGGKLSPLDNVGPQDLRIAGLLDRVKSGVTEVILALGSDVEGDATCHYLADILASSGVNITRLAQGMPAGGGLEHADPLTLMRALSGRRSV